MNAGQFELELSSFETIARGGVRKVTWLVEQQDDWVAVAHAEGAQVHSEEAGRGTVWQQRVCICLPTGARLMRVESKPAPKQTKDPFDYLYSARSSTQREVRRTFFRVNARGTLVRLERAPQLR
jgi:hypothetical protein